MRIGWSLIGIAALASLAGAQALHDSAHVPQPHLARARAYAAQASGWRHPGLGVCYWDDGQAAENAGRDPGGRKVFDNLYYVGSGALGVWAIDTPDGIILIDAMNSAREAETFILPGLRSVGLDPARLKVLIVSHGHADHFGGARFLKAKFGVRIYMSAADWALAARQTLRPWQDAAPDRDGTVADSDTIRLGTTALRVFVTPGHTPGSLAMLLPVADKGQRRTLLYVSGISNRNLSAEMHAVFDRSFERLIRIAGTASVDGYIASHSSFDDAVFKLEWLRANPSFPNPFLIGTRDTLLFLKEVKECNLNSADLSRSMPDRRTSPRLGRD